jgi:diguanylate cyclase (GGDEF)-like protein
MSYYPIDASLHPQLKNALRLIERTGLLLSLKEAHSREYVYVNAEMAQLLGKSESEILGQTDAELLPLAQYTLLRASEQTALAQNDVQWSEHSLDQAGLRREFDVHRMVLQPLNAGQAYLLAAWNEKTHIHQLQERLGRSLKQIEQQQVDMELLRRQLTETSSHHTQEGFYDQYFFNTQLRRDIDLSMREQREFALLNIELDPLSESAAHAGDKAQERIFEALGRLLQSNTRAMDASCRVGDRAFAVLLSGVGLAVAYSRADALRRHCASHIVSVGEVELGFTVSVGVASFPHTSRLETMLREGAHQALHKAKQRGGNRIALAGIEFAKRTLIREHQL